MKTSALLVVLLLAVGCDRKSAHDKMKEDADALKKDVETILATGEHVAASVDAHPDAKAVAVKVGTTFEPSAIPAKKGEPLAIEFMRTTDKTCAKEVIFDGGPLKGTQVDLPLDKPVRVSFTPTADGEIVFGCNMGRMISGKVHVSS